MDSKNKSLYLYYLILLVMMLLRTSTEAPNIILRLSYLSLFLIPLFFIDKRYFPPILICFMAVGTYGFAFNYLPYEMAVYFVITLMFVFIRRIRIIKSQISVIFILTLLFALFRNIIDSYSPQNIFYCIAIIGMFSLIIDRDYQKTQYYMLLAFIIASISLSLLYIFNYNDFVVDYDASKGLERSGWIDPNYFSCVLGMGSLSSFILLLKYPKIGIIIRLVLIITIILPFVALVMTASRGGALAIFLGFSTLLLFSKIKFTTKLFFVCSLICLVSWMYINGYFQLLEYRIQNDGGGGSGRFDIWINKLRVFYTQGNIFYWIFGYGYQSGFQLSGARGVVAFHNDFVAILCEYGILGLLVYFYWIIYPLAHVANKNRAIVYAMMSYLFVVCVTLEPISSGALVYFAFYYLIVLIAKEGSYSKDI